MNQRMFVTTLLLLISAVLIAAPPEKIQPVVTDIDPGLTGLSGQFGGTLSFGLGGSGQVYFTSGYATGFFSWSSAAPISRLLQSGDPAPSIANSTLDGVGQGMQVNELGHAAFIQSYGLKGSPSQVGIFLYTGTAYEVVVKRGDPLPGTGGKLASPGRFVLNNSDVIAFEGRSEPSAYGKSGIFKWTSGGGVVAIAVDGDTGPGGDTYGSVSLIGVNADGDVAFLSKPPSGTPQAVLYVNRSGTTSKLLATGDAAGLTLDLYTAAYRLGPGGKVAFTARQGSLRGIWITDGAVLTKVMLQDEPAAILDNPGATWAGYFGNIYGFNSNGKVLFYSEFKTSGSSYFYRTGLFLWSPAASEAPATLNTIAYQTQSIDTIIAGASIDTATPGVLNDSNVVAFRSTIKTAASATSYALLRWNGTLSKIVAEGDVEPGGGKFGLADRSSTLFLNNAGQLLFQADILVSNQGTGLFLAPPAGAIQSVVDTNDSLPPGARTVLRRIGLMPASDDELVFAALKSGGKSAFYTKAFKKGTVRRIVGEGDPLPGGGIVVDVYNPMINDREEVAFTVGDEVGGLTYYREGVYIHSPTDGVIHQIVATGVGIPGGGFTYNRPSLQGFNHQGKVVLQSDIYNPAGVYAGMGVFVGSIAGGVQTIAKTGDTLSDGTLITGPNAPAINNKGDVAFRANLGDSYPYTNAILIRTAGAVSVEKVAQVGDPVAGSTISALSIPPLRLNKLGKVAYVCTLENGRSAIVLGSTAAAETVAITGDAAPSGGNFKRFEYTSVLLNNSSQVAFWAETDSLTVRSGLFLGSAGSAPVARIVEGQSLPDGATAGPLLPGSGLFTLADSGALAVQLRNFGTDPDFARIVIITGTGALDVLARETDVAKTAGGGRYGRLSGVWTNSASNFFFHALLVEGSARYGSFWDGKRVP